MGLLRIIGLFFIGVVVYYVWLRLWRGMGQTGQGIRPPNRNVGPQGGQLVQDPHCKGYVAPQDAFSVMVGKTTLYFCSEACARHYLEKPSQSRG